MDALAMLRERGRWTRAAILALLLREPGMSRSAIATKLGLTAQAVSVQVHNMIQNGLLVDAGRLQPTPVGIQGLQEEADALGNAASQLHDPLSRLEAISAAATTRIRAGDVVGLWMVSGDLVADPKRVGPSSGVAENDAAQGDEVRVYGAQGVVELQPGRIDVIRVPEPARGGVAAVDKESLPPIDLHHIVAAQGTGAAILAKQVGRLDIRFAAAEGALNAAQRGMDVRLYVSSDQVADVLHVIEVGNSGMRVEVTVRDAIDTERS